VRNLWPLTDIESLGIILAAVIFFSNYVLSYAQELPAKTDKISDITSEIAIPTATSVQQHTPQDQFITPGLSSRGDQDNSIRNSPLEPETQEKASDLTMIQPDIIQQQKKQKGTFTEQQIDNQEVSKDIISDKKRQLDKIMEDSLTESKSTLQPEDSEEKQQDKYSDDDNTDSEDQEEIQQDERVNDEEEEENNNHQNNNDKDDNNNDNIPLELPIPFP
jgi:hypothetical protein